MGRVGFVVRMRGKRWVRRGRWIDRAAQALILLVFEAAGLSVLRRPSRGWCWIALFQMVIRIGYFQGEANGLGSLRRKEGRWGKVRQAMIWEFALLFCSALPRKVFGACGFYGHTAEGLWTNAFGFMRCWV